MKNFVREQAARVNAGPALSEFELSVMDDIVRWIHVQTKDPSFAMTTKEAIIAYWDERLN